MWPAQQVDRPGILGCGARRHVPAVGQAHGRAGERRCGVASGQRRVDEGVRGPASDVPDRREPSRCRRLRTDERHHRGRSGGGSRSRRADRRAGQHHRRGHWPDAFEGIDSTLLYAAMTVVIVILLLSYRSPLLWALPVLSAFTALTVAQAVVYLLAEYADLTVNAQTAGILLVLVFGASTDYALLLVARYREELRRHVDRHEAMAFALHRARPGDHRERLDRRGRHALSAGRGDELHPWHGPGPRDRHRHRTR